ncbi:MAG TPA: PilN domain-containing protein [Gemmatimonadales bacterium]|nr:PilN domain-containing protein [Gemmatimonadales bacterium]
MIEINLRPGQKRSTGGSPLAALRSQLSGLREKMRDPLPLVAAGVVVLALLFLGWSWFSTGQSLRALEPQLEQARQENQRFRNFVAQKRKVELIRDSLVAQITVLQSVDGERYVWPHVMDEVTRALPPYTWLVDLGASSPVAAPPVPGSPGDTVVADTTAPVMRIQINGRTVDVQAFTRFLRQLEASPWITDVQPISAQTVVQDERPVTAFSIRAAFRKADSAYIRTVPLSQSVR